MNRRNLYIATLHRKNQEISDLINRMDALDRELTQAHKNNTLALRATGIMAFIIVTMGIIEVVL